MKDYLQAGTAWYNELGSVMTITSVDCLGGNFDGTYRSSVGEADDKYTLRGRFDIKGQSLGWAVSWQNDYQISHSTTSWSGQVQDTPEGVQEILTTWLLTVQTDPEENWESTLVGFDTFTRTPPSPEQIQRAKRRCQSSHPKAAAKVTAK